MVKQFQVHAHSRLTASCGRMPGLKEIALSSLGKDEVTSKLGVSWDTKMWTELHDPRKAGCEEGLNSRRPKQNGKVAWDQPLSEMLQHKILLRQLRRLESNKDGKQPKDEDGTQRSKCIITLHTLIQLLSKCNSTWGLQRSASFSWMDVAFYFFCSLYS